MGKIEQLLKRYDSWMATPWPSNLAGPQKIWFAVYDPVDERRLRLRLDDFGNVTRRRSHGWKLIDLTDDFAAWMSGQEYRESYFQTPEDLQQSALEDFLQQVATKVRGELSAASQDDVIAVVGVGALFGLIKTSDLMKAVETAIRGRLLVFFPGVHDNNNYRLFDARDGWNYLAVPISASDSTGEP